MGGDKGRAVSTPSTRGRGDRGLGPSSLAPTCLLYPCLHWARASHAGSGSHRAEVHIFSPGKSTLLTPWGPRELGSTPHNSSVSLQSPCLHLLPNSSLWGLCPAQSRLVLLCPAAQQVPLVELGKLFRALGGRRGSAGLVAGPYTLQTHPSLTIRPLLTSWPPLVDAPGLSLWFIPHSCLNTHSLGDLINLVTFKKILAAPPEYAGS